MTAQSKFSERSPPHSVSAEEVLAALGSDARRGLTRTEARARLDRFGANVLTAEKPVPLGGSLSRHFKTRSSFCCWSPGHIGHPFVHRARRGLAL